MKYSQVKDNSTVRGKDKLVLKTAHLTSVASEAQGTCTFGIFSSGKGKVWYAFRTEKLQSFTVVTKQYSGKFPICLWVTF